jgi:hypothetical protein
MKAVMSGGFICQLRTMASQEGPIEQVAFLFVFGRCQGQTSIGTIVTEDFRCLL